MLNVKILLGKRNISYTFFLYNLEFYYLQNTFKVSFTVSF